MSVESTNQGALHDARCAGPHKIVMGVSLLVVALEYQVVKKSFRNGYQRSWLRFVIRLHRFRTVLDGVLGLRQHEPRGCGRTHAACRSRFTGRCWTCETRRRWCGARETCVSVYRIDSRRIGNRPAALRRRNHRRQRNRPTGPGTISTSATFPRIRDERYGTVPRSCPGRYPRCAPLLARYPR